MDHTPDAILRVLDEASRVFSFPSMDNGYIYLAATRLSLFRSETDWAMVIEVFGYSPRGGIPHTSLYTFASRLHDRDPRENYVSEDAYQNYLQNHPHNEVRYVYPIEEGGWMDEAEPEAVAASGELQLRGETIEVPSKAAYSMRGIKLEGPRPMVFELCRFLAAEYRQQVLTTSAEQRVSIRPEMSRILQLDEWHHPDLTGDEMPSATETFRQLAEVLASGDPSRYHPSEVPNTHWKNWPEGGTL
jgi:hypothetical protein